MLHFQRHSPPRQFCNHFKTTPCRRTSLSKHCGIRADGKSIYSEDMLMGECRCSMQLSFASNFPTPFADAFCNVLMHSHLPAHSKDRNPGSCRNEKQLLKLKKVRQGTAEFTPSHKREPQRLITPSEESEWMCAQKNHFSHDNQAEQPTLSFRMNLQVFGGFSEPGRRDRAPFP